MGKFDAIKRSFAPILGDPAGVTQENADYTLACVLVPPQENFAMKIAPSPDPGHCPLCGKTNQCAMVLERTSGAKQPPCWCTLATFSADLLAQLPAESKGLACVCAECAQTATPC